MMYLTYSKTQERVAVGDVVHTFRGDPVEITGIELPKQAGFLGRVRVRNLSEKWMGLNQVFPPQMIGAEWVGRKAPMVQEVWHEA